jgi:hypothetical protein
VGGTLFIEHLEMRVLPSFHARRAFDAGDSPSSVAVGDVNVLLGNGDGAFQAARNFPAGSGIAQQGKAYSSIFFTFISSPSAH